MNLMKMIQRWLAIVAATVFSAPALALDSYRYLHVTIDTIWYIFVFLLLILLIPFILMAVLYWWVLRTRREEERERKRERETEQQ
jgi:heme/copper-type cytochrome/quinol oxidase subunit 2